LVRETGETESAFFTANWITSAFAYPTKKQTDSNGPFVCPQAFYGGMAAATASASQVSQFDNIEADSFFFNLDTLQDSLLRTVTIVAAENAST
jgi:hypothetical protein